MPLQLPASPSNAVNKSTMSTKVTIVIKNSAFKHGLTRYTIEHALNNALFWFDMDDFDMYIGPGSDRTLIEVGVNRDGDVFHAMPA